jgi:Flp pilus assembly CpaF family ATPase
LWFERDYAFQFDGREPLRANISETVLVPLINEQKGEKAEIRDEREFSWCCSTIRDLLKATLRHRPDRIIVGEIRGGEAFDLLQLLNTGHSGTLSTVHANSAAQGISRFTTCVLQSGVEMPYRAIKTNIADSLNVIVQIERRPGKRFVSEVLEIRGYDQSSDHYDLRQVTLASKDAWVTHPILVSEA